MINSITPSVKRTEEKKRGISFSGQETQREYTFIAYFFLGILNGAAESLPLNSLYQIQSGISTNPVKYFYKDSIKLCVSFDPWAERKNSGISAKRLGFARSARSFSIKLLVTVIGWAAAGSPPTKTSKSFLFGA